MSGRKENVLIWGKGKTVKESLFRTLSVQETLSFLDKNEAGVAKANTTVDEVESWESGGLKRKSQFKDSLAPRAVKLHKACFRKDNVLTLLTILLDRHYPFPPSPNPTSHSKL